MQFDIRNEVDIVLSMFDEKVLQKQLEVAALIHDSVPPSLMGDPGRIRQVFISGPDLLRDSVLWLKIAFRVVDSLKVGGMYHMRRNQHDICRNDDNVKERKYFFAFEKKIMRSSLHEILRIRILTRWCFV